MARTATTAWRWITVSLVLGGTLGARGLVMAGSTEQAPATEQSRTILAEEARARIAKAAREPTAAERRAFEYVKRHYAHAPAGTILVQSEEGEHWESPGPTPEPDYDPELSALDPRWAKGTQGDHLRDRARLRIRADALARNQYSPDRTGPSARWSAGQGDTGRRRVRRTVVLRSLPSVFRSTNGSTTLPLRTAGDKFRGRLWLGGAAWGMEAGIWERT